jgi:transcription elongation factor Elf1
MSYIDAKYLNLISAQLRNFKRKNDTLWNFSCPYCGDSQKDKTKARGYVFQREGKYIFKCHNCGQGASLSNLVKHVNPHLHKEYVLESFGDRNKETKEPKYKKVDVRKLRKPKWHNQLKDINKISQLKFDHPAKEYVEKRRIPISQHYKLFYAPKFYRWVNTLVPDKFPQIQKDEPRLVIPFINEHDELIGFQGRAFGKSQPKYITIMLDEDAPKIFGLDSVKWNDPVVIVEGPIDAMFLPNAIAMAGSDSARFNHESAVYCWDNEPRSVENIKRIERAIEEGKSVVIFPNGIEEKDINDMVMAGRDLDEISAIISNNTFKGLMAKAKLSEWRKV